MCFLMWEKSGAKNGEKICQLQLCVSQCAYLHVYVCMAAASRASHVVDMANIRQMFLIPHRTLRLPLSFTSVHVCCLSVDYFIAAMSSVCSWQCLYV